jgi:trimeric autotransporter adhesin
LNTGGDNTAVGVAALETNSTGNFNTASGAFALFSNTTGNNNTANGFQALFSNDVGFGNAAVGDSSLTSNSSGANNAAMGSQALTANDTGNFNTAVGVRALEDNVSGSDNTAIGWDAGRDVDGSGNICIGSGAYGFPGQDGIIQIGGEFSGHNACYIDGIYGQAWGTADMAVRIGNDGKLGTVVSSRRFKHDIKQMDKASEAILALKPVTFPLQPRR